MTKAMKIILILAAALVLLLGGFAWYITSAPGRAGTHTEAKVEEKTAAVAAAEPEKQEEEPVEEALTEELINEETGEIEIISVDADPVAIQETEQISDEVYNVLLIGVDSREPDQGTQTKLEGRSDTMILASYNTRLNRITLVSFLRDTEVWRFGEKKTRPTFKGKLNGAFQSGGAGELINTLNSDRNFNLDIQNYFAIGFIGIWVMVDSVGGVDIHLTPEEAYYINWRNAGYYKNDDKTNRIKTLRELNERHDLHKQILEEVDGVQTLYGETSIWYVRDRYTPEFGGAAELEESGNSDTGRTSRQQYFLKQWLKKARQVGFLELLKKYQQYSYYAETNMSLEDIVSLGTKVISGNPEIVSLTCPFEGTYHSKKKEKNEQGEEVITEGIFITDFKTVQDMLYQALYTDEGLVPEEPDIDDSYEG